MQKGLMKCGSHWGHWTLQDIRGISGYGVWRIHGQNTAEKNSAQSDYYWFVKKKQHNFISFSI